MKNFIYILSLIFVLNSCGGGGNSNDNGSLSYDKTPKEQINVGDLANIDKNMSEDIVKLSFNNIFFNVINDLSSSPSASSNTNKHYKIIDPSSTECPYGGKATADDVNYIIKYDNCKNDMFAISGVIDYENPNISTNLEAYNLVLNYNDGKKVYFQKAISKNNSLNLTGYIKSNSDILKFKDLQVTGGTTLEMNGYISSSKYLNNKWIKLTTKEPIVKSSDFCMQSGDLLVEGANGTSLEVKYNNCQVKIYVNNQLTKTYESLMYLLLSIDNPAQNIDIIKGQQYVVDESNTTKEAYKIYYSALNSTKQVFNKVENLINNLYDITTYNCNSGDYQVENNIATYTNCQYNGYTINGKVMIIENDYNINSKIYASSLEAKNNNSTLYLKNMYVYYIHDQVENKVETLQSSGFYQEDNKTINFLNLSYNTYSNYTLKIDGSIATSCLNNKWIDIKTNQNIQEITETAGEVEVNTKNNKFIISFYENTNLPYLKIKYNNSTIVNQFNTSSLQRDINSTCNN